MQKYWSICVMALVCTVVAGGCNQMNVKQDANTTFEQVRDKFDAQKSYAFYGQTKLLTANSANANMVNFSGRKDGEAVYLNVKLSVPEENRVDNLSLLSHGDKLYTKHGQNEGWSHVAGDSPALHQEMNNWNPIASFQQIDDMKRNVRMLPDDNPKDDFEALGVVLDSAKLKSWLVAQMQEQTKPGAKVQSIAGREKPYIPKLKLAMALSEGNWRGTPAQHSGPTIQSRKKVDVNELVNQMEVEAEYTIHYNKKTMLPTNMTMSIRSSYDLNDQRVKEHTQVETYLQQYGTVAPIIAPTENSK
ncbi:hypothetical protein ABER61_10060 [Brevibacillus formosus]|uniref:Lipoprotein n=1 Tax=Brevibacillus formosus TaxID=54913 RepID=A0A837KJT8_9BACL|nr:hypothetical protein [Brevibacillus formosus]KLH97990.1 hypothetical protein AA984_19200 [Brevibacillus formosus]MED1957191.1 hypothetical protein [Brevibacillus formosus]PSJ91418.1 hypothetical protein C7R91_25180 [Brevibacillus formosus]GED57306.1 hypothetical protein BFO01nite_14380 [Brevibacillus formosus]